jgi:hypothetical protein
MEFATPAAAYNLPVQEVKVVLYEKPKLPKPYSAAFHLKGIKLTGLLLCRASKRNQHSEQDSPKTTCSDRTRFQKDEIKTLRLRANKSGGVKSLTYTKSRCT